jgi:hypothetical protein
MTVRNILRGVLGAVLGLFGNVFLTPLVVTPASAQTPSASEGPMTKQSDVPPPINAPNNQGIISFGQTGDNYINKGPVITASVQRQEATGNPEQPWKTEFFINTTASAQTGDLRLKCSGPCLRAGIGRISKFGFVSGNNGPIPADPTTVLYELGPETLVPGLNVPVAVYSTQPVTVTSGSIGTYNIIFQDKK